MGDDERAVGPPSGREARNEQRKLRAAIANAIAIALVAGSLAADFINPVLAGSLSGPDRLAMLLFGGILHLWRAGSFVILRIGIDGLAPLAPGTRPAGLDDGVHALASWPRQVRCLFRPPQPLAPTCISRRSTSAGCFIRRTIRGWRPSWAIWSASTCSRSARLALCGASSMQRQRHRPAPVRGLRLSPYFRTCERCCVAARANVVTSSSTEARPRNGRASASTMPLWSMSG